MNEDVFYIPYVDIYRNRWEFIKDATIKDEAMITVALQSASGIKDLVFIDKATGRYGKFLVDEPDNTRFCIEYIHEKPSIEKIKNRIKRENSLI